MMIPIKVKRSDEIYKEERYPNAVYFILKGRINCLNTDEVTFKNYIQDSYFGEIEIIKNHQLNKLNLDLLAKRSIF